MSYRVVNIINNNFVLLSELGGGDNQIIVMGKGIGFGKIKGEIIDIDNNKNSIYALKKNDTLNFNQLSSDLKEVEQITTEVVDIARKKLGITNENLYLALLDHISFSIQRIRLGMPIENPFIVEIITLYREEFEVANYVAEQISKRIGIEIGEAEKGFIALHLYSGRKNNPVNIAMKNIRLCKEAILIINKYCNVNINENTSAYKSFLLSFDKLVCINEKGRNLELPLKNQIKAILNKQYEVALKISKVIYKELGVELSDEIIAFLTIDIYKLIQI